MKSITRSTRKSALRPTGVVKRKKAHEAKRVPPMVARVAAAIAKRAKYTHPSMAIDLARDAIKAMRKPTDEVVQWASMAEIGSVWETVFPGDRKKKPVTFPLGIALLDTGCREPAKAILAAWQEMVDAALETKPYHVPRKEPSHA